MKPVRFVGTSRDDLRRFPEAARRMAGFALDAVQRGHEPHDWKPMPGVGPGAREIRIRVSGEWRVIYVASFVEAIYVLHEFQKQTQRTPRHEIELARRRYDQIGALS